MLLEFPDDHIPLGVEKLIGWLIERDILPLIAHPERNRAIIRQSDKISPFLRLGCLLQITADSVTGLFGADVQRCAFDLIKNNQVFAIATDAHNLHKRKPTFSHAKNILKTLIEDEQIMAMMVNNPKQVVSVQANTL